MSLRGCLAIFGLLAVLLLGYLGFHWARTSWIPAGHVGVLYSAQRGLQPQIYTPRRIYVPLLHQLYTYPTKTKAAIYTQDATEGEEKAADGIQVTSKDNAVTTFDVSVFYRVKPEDVLLIFKTFGAIPIEDIQRLHIRRAVAEAANVVGTQSDVFGIMGKDRKQACDLLLKEVRQRLAPKGITVEDARFGTAAPQDTLVAKVTSRVNSLTDLVIARLKNEMASVTAKTAMVKSRAETEAAALTSTQTSDRSLELLSMDVTAEALKKWKGHLPRYPGAKPTIFGSEAARKKAVTVQEQQEEAK